MKIWTDGGSRSNPGPAAWAFVTDTGHCEGAFLGLSTNNIAEYTAMENALTYLLDHEGQHEIYTDSRLLEGQIMCGWKVKAKHLKHYVDICKQLVLGQDVHIYYVPREQNKEADRLVNEILDAQKG